MPFLTIPGLFLVRCSNIQKYFFPPAIFTIQYVQQHANYTATYRVYTYNAYKELLHWSLNAIPGLVTPPAECYTWASHSPSRMLYLGQSLPQQNAIPGLVTPPAECYTWASHSPQQNAIPGLVTPPSRMLYLGQSLPPAECYTWASHAPQQNAIPGLVTPPAECYTWASHSPSRMLYLGQSPPQQSAIPGLVTPPSRMLYLGQSRPPAECYTWASHSPSRMLYLGQSRPPAECCTWASHSPQQNAIPGLVTPPGIPHFPSPFPSLPCPPLLQAPPSQEHFVPLVDVQLSCKLSLFLDPLSVSASPVSSLQLFTAPLSITLLQEGLAY